MAQSFDSYGNVFTSSGACGAVLIEIVLTCQTPCRRVPGVWDALGLVSAAGGAGFGRSATWEPCAATVLCGEGFFAHLY
jgi:hypothetical protein